VNRGFRIEFNSAIGPYKGGLRFHPSVNLSILKFLGFEQTFKNSLTTLADGRWQGRQRFRPERQERWRSDAFLPEPDDRAVPPHRPQIPTCLRATSAWAVARSATCSASTSACANEFTGVLHRQRAHLGRFLIRPEATGYGCVYFAEEMMKHNKTSFKGKTVAVSGSGNVAQYAIEKATALGCQSGDLLRQRRQHLRPQRHHR
jgi:glutamate dehydrogenase (NADP+)